jgi:hypothetical protein
MEHTLLTPSNITLKKQGIPYSQIEHLLTGGRFHDANLKKGFGRDEEIEEINRMEESLGNLSPEQIDLRVATDFCCIWRYDYPRRVHEICSIIGGSPHTALRLHYQICLGRRQEFIDYADALKGWLMDEAPDDATHFRNSSEKTVQKVYQFLGKKDPLKKMLVERTYLGLSSRFLNCSFWGVSVREPETPLIPYTAQQLPDEWPERLSELEYSIRKEMGHTASDFLCEVGGSAEPACHFKFVRRVDILVSSIGCMRWRGNLPIKDGSVKGRRQLTKLYSDILEKYWNGNNSSYTNKNSEQLEKELFEQLGEPSDLKRWLVASLWKNIKNQTLYNAYPMKRWVEFVRIGEDYIKGLARGKN